jgi:hypothetical protein
MRADISAFSIGPAQAQAASRAGPMLVADDSEKAMAGAPAQLRI